MTNTALQLEKFKTTDQLLPRQGPNVYAAGYKDADKGHIRYGSKPSDQPTLSIIDPIRDDNGDIIMPGFYTLGLSEDRQNLVLSQDKYIVAIIPVFKIQEDKSQIKAPQPMDWKSQKKADWKERKEEKKKKKLARQGKLPEEPTIYNNATIEYQPDGDYYLIKYERAQIRAWGAIKL